MFKKDYCDKEFRRMVVLGESTVQGGGWLQSEDQRFGDVVAKLITLCQAEPVEYFNAGVSASVISPRSPGYDDSGKPSAMERYRESVVDRNPDLFLFCYGLNDMRCGTPIPQFIEDMETITREVKAACNPVTVLTTVYHMTGWDRYAPFNVGSIQATKDYNAAIGALAEKHDCILADVWEAEGLADHLIHPDGVHANAVGSLLIAHKIFEILAQNCSGLSRRTHEVDADTDWGRFAISVAYRERGNEVKGYDPGE